MSADTWAAIHTYGLVFSIGYILGVASALFMVWRDTRRRTTSARKDTP